MTQDPAGEDRALEIEEEQEEEDVAEQLKPGDVAAVISPTDWTTETIVSQLKRKNIELSPRFQRRDAWNRSRKSRFIESLIVGLPIPQIVLAESKDDRGKFIVLDGKQRLLSILQFWGLGEGDNNAFELSGLTLRDDLKGRTYAELSTKGKYEGDWNSLCNQSIRTVVIRNWKDSNFLHTVFLRLNTGGVNLSPQELRQALLPGLFSDYVDEAAGNSVGLRKVLGIASADPRMQDIEILARFLAFRFFADTYPGRLKAFLDKSFKTFNERWTFYKPQVEAAQADFEAGLTALLALFAGSVARKPSSRPFNRAIFDALIFYHSQPRVRRLLEGKDASVIAAYAALFTSDTGFLKAVESDTAGAPNTSTRFRLWAKSLSTIAGETIDPPAIPQAGEPAAKKKQAGGTRAKPRA